MKPSEAAYSSFSTAPFLKGETGFSLERCVSGAIGPV